MRVEPDPQEAHPRSLPGESPEDQQVEGAHRQPYARAQRQRPVRVALVVAVQRRADQGDYRRQGGEGEVDDHRVDPDRQGAADQAGVAGGLLPRGPGDHPARQPLQSRVDAVGEARHLAADVGDQPDPLGGDRGPHLGRLGDPLDQLLGLITRQQPSPDLVDQLAVQRLDHRLLQRLALQGALHRLLHRGTFQDPGQRPLHRLALDRRDDRLLGRGLHGPVDTGGARDRLGSANACAEQAGREGKGTLRAAVPRWGRRRIGSVSHRAASLTPPPAGRTQP